MSALSPERLPLARARAMAERIVTSEHVQEQYRFPRTKKRRLRNKWLKRPENFRPARHALVDEEGTIYIHPTKLSLLNDLDQTRGGQRPA